MCKEDTVGKGVPEEEKKEILYPECRIGKKKLQQNWRVVVCPDQGKIQQSSMRGKPPKSIVRERDKQRDIRRAFKLLREVWLDIGVEKVNMLKRYKRKIAYWD